MWCVWGGYTHLTPLHALSFKIMVTIKPMSGTNPGFAAIEPTAVAAVTYTPSIIKVKGAEHSCNRVDFIGADKNVFASINDYRDGSALAYIYLVDEKRFLGSFLEKETKLELPQQGVLSSVPLEGDRYKGKSANGTEWRRHQTNWSGVTFKDFKQL